MRIRVLALLVGTGLRLGCGDSDLTASCGANEAGKGQCDFTNAGDTAGTLCVKVRVTDQRGLGAPITSDSVCSGQLRPHETRSVPFTMAGLGRLCGPSPTDRTSGTAKRWDENCAIATTTVDKP
jgi:hypothetical protein